MYKRVDPILDFVRRARGYARSRSVLYDPPLALRASFTVDIIHFLPRINIQRIKSLLFCILP